MTATCAVAFAMAGTVTFATAKFGEHLLKHLDDVLDHRRNVIALSRAFGTVGIAALSATISSPLGKHLLQLVDEVPDLARAFTLAGSAALSSAAVADSVGTICPHAGALASTFALATAKVLQQALDLVNDVTNFALCALACGPCAWTHVLPAARGIAAHGLAAIGCTAIVTAAGMPATVGIATLVGMFTP